MGLGEEKQACQGQGNASDSDISRTNGIKKKKFQSLAGPSLKRGTIVKACISLLESQTMPPAYRMENSESQAKPGLGRCFGLW